MPFQVVASNWSKTIWTAVYIVSLLAFTDNVQIFWLKELGNPFNLLFDRSSKCFCLMYNFSSEKILLVHRIICFLKMVHQIILCKLNFRFCNLLLNELPLVCFGLCNTLSECQTILYVVFDCISQITPNHSSFCNHVRFGCFLSVNKKFVHASLVEVQHLIELWIVLHNEYIFRNRNNFSNDDYILRKTTSYFSGTSNFFF